MIRCINHVNIVVTDLERSERFYVDVLGFEATRRAHLEGPWIEAVTGLADVRADVVFLEPPGGGPRIELIAYAAPQGEAAAGHASANTVGLRHIAFSVDDMDAVVARLAAQGVRLLSEPTFVPGDVVRHDEGRKRLCYFHDPDGVLLELAEYRSGSGE